MAHHVTVGQQFNPFDVVFRCHGVFHTPHADAVAAFNALYYGHMFLYSTIDTFLVHTLHEFSAA